ncbi:MAG: hypothetical protein NVSMB30_16070 [Hymenobacter sp.]
MRYFALLLLFAFGFSLSACAQQVATGKAKVNKVNKETVAKPTSEAGPVLTFERTPCYGPCPGYTMQIFANGRVAYEGRRAVPLMGKKELRLPPAVVAEMLRTAREAHFDQFQDRYARGATDLPSTIVAVRQPTGQLKTVAVEDGAPENVQNLFTYLGKQFDALAQLGPKSDK